jgi:uncharacterized small protein (DUF1192 family)
MPFANKNAAKAKGADPISDRARALNEQIAALESEIKRLDNQLQHAVTPKLRSTTLPHGQTIARKPEPPPAPKSAAPEPVFEEVKPIRAGEEAALPEQFNDLGVRKYDLPGLIGRIRGLFSRPVAANPRLVTYLAAGGVRGLRPLRYEKRVARNRVVALAAVLLVVLLCISWILLHH